MESWAWSKKNLLLNEMQEQFQSHPVQEKGWCQTETIERVNNLRAMRVHV